MINKTYAAYILRDFWPHVLFVSVFGMLITFALPYFFGTFEMAKVMKQMMESMPPAMRAMMNNDIEGFLSVEGSVGFSLKHPITITVLSYMAIVLPVKYIGRAIEQGKMEILLTLPMKRSELMRTFLVMAAFFFLVTVLLLALGSYIGIQSLDATTFKYVLFGKDLILVFVFYFFIFSVSLAGTVWFKDPGQGILVTIVYLASFYLIDILSQYRPWLANLTKRINLFKYYETQEIMNSKGNWNIDLIVLGVATALLVLFSWTTFKRRDIP